MNTRVEDMETQLTPGREMAVVNPQSAALEAKERALIYARYEMALRLPTNWEQARIDILKECRRPSFARDKSVLYGKPIGDTKIEGLGIRFTEMAMRCIRNIATDVQTVYEDDYRRVLRVTVTNLQANQPESDEVTVPKTIERSRPGKDGSFISVRNNSKGQPTYLLPATDDDLLITQGRLVSKIRRNLALRHIPADIQEEAETIIRAVRSDAAAKDPDAERREIFDGFSKLNVPIEELEEYLGHPVANASPGELVNLRTVWGTIADGETSWAAVLQQRREELERSGRAAPAVAPTERGQRRRARGVAAMEAQVTSAPAPAPAPAARPEGPSAPAMPGPAPDPRVAAREASSAPAGAPAAPGVLMTADITGEFLGRYTGRLENLVEGSIMEIEGADYRVAVVRADRIVLALLQP